MVVPCAARRATLVLVRKPGLGLRARHAERDLPALRVGHPRPARLVRLVRVLHERETNRTPLPAGVRKPLRV